MNTVKFSMIFLPIVVFNSILCMNHEQIDGRKVTKHFAQRMKERDIDEQKVKHILRNGKMSRSKSSNIILESTGRKKIRLVLDKKMNTLITAINVSQSSKKNLFSRNQKMIASLSAEQMDFKSRKKINNEFILIPKTHLEKNIEKSISNDDQEMTIRLLNLGTPYNSKDQTLARCFMIATNLKKRAFAKLVVEYAKFPKQLEIVLKDANFKKLSLKNKFHKLLSNKLLALKLEPKNEHVEQIA